MSFSPWVAMVEAAVVLGMLRVALAVALLAAFRRLVKSMAKVGPAERRDLLRLADRIVQLVDAWRRR